MWIESLRVVYGRLDGEFTFSDGLNIVHGPNESGKSTLHDAVLRSLFGFSPSERRQRHGFARRDQGAPWSGGSHTAVATIRAVRERDLRIEWNFAEDRVVVRDAATGEEVLSDQPLQRQEFRIGPNLFGIGLEEFRQVACLFQDAASPVEHSEDIVLALQRSVENAAADVGVEAADAKLSELLSAIGVHAGNYSSLASGKLRRAEQRRDELTASLQHADQTQAELEASAAELKALDARIGEALEARAALAQTLLRRRATERQRRVEQAEALRAEARKRPATIAILDPELEKAVTSERGILDAARTAAEELSADADSAKAQATKLLEAHRKLVRERDAVAPYAEFDQASADKIRDLRGQLNALEEDRAEPALVPDDPRLEQFRERRERLRLVSGASRSGWRPSLVAAAAAVAALSVAAAAAVPPAAALGLIVAAALAWAGRPRAAQPAELATELKALGATSLDALEGELAEHDAAVAAATALHQAWSEERELRRQQRDEIAAELDRLLPEPSSPSLSLEDRLEAYDQAGAKHQAYLEATTKVAEVERDLANATEPQTTYAQRVADCRAAETRLRVLYRQAGIENDDLEPAGDAFDRLAKQASEDRRLVADSQRADVQLRELLADRTEESLRADAESAAKELREHVAQHGDRGELTEDMSTLEQRLSEISGELGNLQEARAGLAATIAQREREAPSAATLREEAAIEAQRIARFVLIRDAARIARDGLAEAARAAHREFAPHLNRALAEGLPRVTGDRYRDATVSDQLEIQVVAPETGTLIPIERLSRGTRDQIAMIERLQIARMLDPTNGAMPLLLDDPFAHFDPVRLAAGVDLLGDVAADRQVMLFTDDPVVVERAQRLGSAPRIIELAGP